VTPLVNLLAVAAIGVWGIFMRFCRSDMVVTNLDGMDMALRMVGWLRIEACWMYACFNWVACGLPAGQFGVRFTLHHLTNPHAVM
jgi:hypothetical protein